jgi:hypothetical protein
LVMVAVIFPGVLASMIFDELEASERIARRKCSRIAILNMRLWL